MINYLRNYNSLLYKLWILLRTNDMVAIYFLYSLLMIFAIYISVPIIFKFIIFPIAILFIYDYVFIRLFYPFIQSIVSHNTNIIHRVAGFNFLFQFNEELDEDTIILTFPSTVIPHTDDYRGIEPFNGGAYRYFQQLVEKIENYLWLCKFYQNHANVKYYLLPYLVIAFHTVFFILMYIFYFGHNNCLYLFVFLLIWLFYSLYNIEDILNLKRYRSFFDEFRSDINYRQFFRHMNIIEVQNQTLVGVQPEYFAGIETSYENEYKQKMDYIIAFMSTVVFVALLTFVGTNPSIECKNKGVGCESNISCVDKAFNREK